MSSLVLILLGTLFYKYPVDVKVSVGVAIILILFPLASTLLTLYVLPSVIIIYIVYVAIFLWFIVNSVMFIVQLCDFFVSTGGLYLLLGSDEKRVFLYPIPLIAISIYVLFIIRYVGTVFPRIIFALAPLVPIVLIHSAAKNMGRPVRSALSIYSISTIYPAIGFVVGFGRSNLAFWAVITILSTLFTAQQYARKAVADKKTPTYLVYMLLGFLLLVCYVLISPLGGLEEIYGIWLTFSITAIGVAPIIALIFIVISGRKEYYLERDHIKFPQLLKETLIILGAKFKDIMKDYLTKMVLSRFFGTSQ